MDNLYNGNGGIVAVNGGSVAVTTAQVVQAIASGVESGEISLPTVSSNGTLSHPSLSSAWITNAETAYSNMLVQMELYGNDAIPFFIQTDLHGRSNDPARWLNNKDPRVKNINLGDNAADYFTTSGLSEYYKSAKPVQNKICVFGNHDAWTKDSSDKQANCFDLSHYFPSDGRRMTSQNGFFTVKDDEYNVKYVIVCPYYLNSTTGTYGVDITVRSAQMAWLISELSTNDGYDIVVLMHQLFTDTHNSRSGTAQAWADAPPVLENVWNVLKDRRNKRAGTITDGEGVQHEYDFTGVKTRILCSLHGHSHEELMLTEDGLTAYAADWYGNNSRCTFGLIDRLNSKVTFWVFDSTGCLDPLELTI